MHSLRYFPWLGLAMMASIVSCGPSFETSPSRVPVSASAAGPGMPVARSNTDLVARLDRAIAGYRSSIGLEAIPRHRGLDALARQHCEFMAKNRGRFTLGSENISHYGFEERALLAKRRYQMGHCAENVAGGVIRGDIPSELIRAWTSSSKHVYNLKQNWHATGIGVYVAPDGFVYATQIFATKGQSRMAFYDHLRDF